MSANESGSAGFLAVPNDESPPAAVAATQLLAYRTVSFTDTKAELIQFALSLSAVQDATSLAVTSSDSREQNTVLQPSTLYDIVMYEGTKAPQVIGSFTTVENLNDSSKGGVFTLSAQNFRQSSTGSYSVPFVSSWITNNMVLLQLIILRSDRSSAYAFLSIGSTETVNSKIQNSIPGEVSNGWGNLARGAFFLAKANAINNHRMTFTIASGPRAGQGISTDFLE